MPDKTKIYPTRPDKDGYYYASQEEEELAVKTKKYENGSATKTLKLSDGREAVVRKLRGRDFVETKKRVQNDNQIDFDTVNMSQAVEIEGKKQPPEYYLDDLFQNDYASLIVAYASLNFQ